MTSFWPGTARKALAITAFCLAASHHPLPAQSLTTGGLTATVLDERGMPLPGVSATLEKGSTAFLVQSTDSRGVVVFSVVPPGRYSLLTEQLGYRPLRTTGLVIAGGGMAALSVRLVRGAPGNTVDERSASLFQARSGVDRVVIGSELNTLDRRRDLTDVSRGFPEVDAPRDGRNGFAASANGRPGSESHLVIDGMDELLFRHPGIRTEPASAPLFARDAFDQVSLIGFGRDVEWPGATGAILTGSTRPGTGAASVLPWFAYSSAKLGGRKADNPADSTASSFEGGLRASGSIKGDTGSWSLRAEYRQLAEPSANPFEVAVGGSDPSVAIRSAVQTLGHGDVASWLAPTVRTWKGGNALGRFDWRFGRSTSLAVRAGMASWSENNPLVGNELSNGAGGRLEANDLSLAAAVTTSGDDWISETRLGVRSSHRDWTGSAVPYTGLVGDGLAIGGSATVPGLFKDTQLQLTEAATFTLGAHLVKGVVDISRRSVTNDWLPYGVARFEFGDVASFAAGRGAFVQSTRTGTAPSVAVSYPSFALQDSWQATPRLQLIGGVRLDAQKFPKALITPDVTWAAAAGLNNTLQPVGSGRLGPRGGMVWTADAAGTTVLRIDAGLVPVPLDLSALTEAIQNAGGVTVQRATGTLTWPSTTAAATPVVRPTLTFFNQGVKSPRAFKGDASLTHRLGQDVTLSLHAAYDHTDYLLRRADLNLIQTPVSTGSDFRPIYGTLEQYNALLTPAVGSNRRFRNVDMAYLLSSTGFADYTEVGAALERRMARGLTMNVSYTWSRTKDNLPGQLSNDVADQLSPFPTSTGLSSWDEGRSDFDVPSRFSGMMEYAAGAISLSGRYRYRSGLPFTPGFARGVDANGDGAVGNDPAPLLASITGMSGLVAQHSCLTAPASFFAVRNSCRDPAVQSLDLHLGVKLPIGGSHPVSLLVDAFNVVSTDVGLFDHAAVLVDAAGSLTYNSAGQLVLPLVANDNFGKLLSRRGEPRAIRIGFRMEN